MEVCLQIRLASMAIGFLLQWFFWELKEKKLIWLASAADLGCAGPLALCRDEGTSLPEHLVHASLDC